MRNVLKYVCVFFLLITSAIGYAENYRLMVDNETDENFMVNTNEPSGKQDLNAYDKQKLYEIAWPEENEAGTKAFTVQFISKQNGPGYSVFLMATESKDTERRVFCSSGSIYLGCQFNAIDKDSGKLVISSRS